MTHKLDTIKKSAKHKFTECFALFQFQPNSNNNNQDLPKTVLLQLSLAKSGNNDVEVVLRKSK